MLFCFSFKDEMIRHVLFKNRNFCLKQSSYLLSFRKSQIIPVACYHTDSIEAPVFDELVVPEAKLSPEETTKILQKNEASVNFEQNGPMRYYEINYLGANNPTGMSRKVTAISSILLLIE